MPFFFVMFISVRKTASQHVEFQSGYAVDTNNPLIARRRGHNRLIDGESRNSQHLMKAQQYLQVVSINDSFHKE